MQLNRVQVKGVSAGEVVVVQMKTRSKSGAFLPCEDLVRRWVVVLTGVFCVNGERSGKLRRCRVRMLGRHRNVALYPMTGVYSTWPSRVRPAPGRLTVSVFFPSLPFVPQPTLNFSVAPSTRLCHLPQRA